MERIRTSPFDLEAVLRPRRERIRDRAARAPAGSLDTPREPSGRGDLIEAKANERGSRSVAARTARSLAGVVVALMAIGLVAVVLSARHRRHGIW